MCPSGHTASPPLGLTSLVSWIAVGDQEFAPVAADADGPSNGESGVKCHAGPHRVANHDGPVISAWSQSAPNHSRMILVAVANQGTSMTLLKADGQLSTPADMLPPRFFLSGRRAVRQPDQLQPRLLRLVPRSHRSHPARRHLRPPCRSRSSPAAECRSDPRILSAGRRMQAGLVHVLLGLSSHTSTAAGALVLF
jgi:hypothetical protein